MDSGDIYRHRNGCEYEIVCMARSSNDCNQQLVVYKSLHPSDYPAGTIWVRTLTEFNTPGRFTLVGVRSEPMPNIETPEEFARKLGEIRVTANIDDGYEGVIAIASKAISARDAAIRAEYAALLKTCGEALNLTVKFIDAGLDAPLDKIESALAALMEAGVKTCDGCCREGYQDCEPTCHECIRFDEPVPDYSSDFYEPYDEEGEAHA